MSSPGLRAEELGSRGSRPSPRSSAVTSGRRAHRRRRAGSRRSRTRPTPGRAPPRRSPGPRPSAPAGAARRGRRASRAACIGVLMMPGATALTRMPLSAYSIASDRVTASSPPLVRDASADGTPFTGWPTSVVVRFTTCPPPCASICRTARCVTWKNPARFTDTTRAKSASVYSVNGLATNIPALLTSVSTRPNFSTAPPITRSATAGSAMSPATARTSPRGVGLDGPGVGDDAVAPRRGYPRTSPAPMPCDAPVMTATFESVLTISLIRG